jgi:hypothetical protein
MPSNVQPLKICRQVDGVPEHVYGLGVVSSGSLTLQLTRTKREKEKIKFESEGAEVVSAMVRLHSRECREGYAR